MMGSDLRPFRSTRVHNPRVVTISLLICFLGATLPSTVHSQSTVLDVTFETDAMPEGTYDFKIYLPDGYVEGGRQYPVAYFLHGYGYPMDVHWNFFQIKTQLDILISSGQIQPVLFVGPDGYGHHYDGNFYANSDLYGQVEDCIVEDLVAYVEANFEAIPRRTHRVILGHSMGGLGAMQLALKHPDVYGAVAAHAGVFFLRWHLDGNIPGIITEADPDSAGPPYEYHPGNGPSTINIFATSGAYSPNLDNQPYLVDFPLDEYGDVIDDVVERWWIHDPPVLAREYAENVGDSLCIAILCGIEDGLIVHAEAFAESLDVLGISYELMPHPGDHLVLPLDLSLPYLLNPNIPCGIVDVGDVAPEADVTMRVRPNPSSSSATVQFTLDTSGPTRLLVYDVGGRLIRSVFDGALDAGPHALTWDGTCESGGVVSPGVYFLTLETASRTEVIRSIRLE